MKLVGFVLIPIVLVLWLLAPPAEGRDLTRGQQSARKAIIDVWPRLYEQAAVRVAWCESRLYRWAANGQYLGVFQMGRWERETFGHGPGTYAQARAALRYFRATGSDWSPWECRWAA